MENLSSEKQCWIKRKLGIRLPPEIMIKILSKLPADAILRLTCAFKSLESLVHEPFFTTSSWKDRHVRTGVMFLMDERKKDELRIRCPELSGHHYDWTVEIGEEEENLGMTNSYNGLVCVYGLTRVWLLNPSIWQMIELPEATTPLQSLACTYYLGLGFVKTTGEYKVVRVYDSCFCEILTLGCSKGSWRQITDKAPDEIVLNSISTTICINEMLHWANCVFGQLPGGIISFDLKDEKFDFISHPVSNYLGRKRYNLLELDGHLCIADVWFSSMEIDIWFMEDYINRRWVKLYSIDLKKMDNFSKLLRLPTRPIGMRDGIIIMWNSEGSLDYYDPKCNTFLEGDDLDPTMIVTMYVGTFVSPISIQGESHRKLS